MADNMDLSGKIALVTGASRGIGRAVATVFAARGARVAVHYHSRVEDGEEVVRSLENGPHALFQADVSDPAGARGLVEAVISEMGTLHLLVYGPDPTSPELTGLLEDMARGRMERGPCHRQRRTPPATGRLPPASPSQDRSRCSGVNRPHPGAG